MATTVAFFVTKAMESSFAWADVSLQMVVGFVGPDAIRNSMLCRGSRACSDFSGMGSEEQAFVHIRAACAKLGMSCFYETGWRYKGGRVTCSLVSQPRTPPHSYSFRTGPHSKGTATLTNPFADCFDYSF